MCTYAARAERLIMARQLVLASMRIERLRYKPKDSINICMHVCICVYARMYICLQLHTYVKLHACTLVRMKTVTYLSAVQWVDVGTAVSRRSPINDEVYIIQQRKLTETRLGFGLTDRGVFDSGFA